MQFILLLTLLRRLDTHLSEINTHASLRSEKLLRQIHWNEHHQHFVSLITLQTCTFSTVCMTDGLVFSPSRAWWSAGDYLSISFALAACIASTVLWLFMDAVSLCNWALITCASLYNIQAIINPCSRWWIHFSAAQLPLPHTKLTLDEVSR